MVNKFVFVIAGVVVAMAVLIALPNVTRPAEDITIDYNKQNLVRTDTGLVVQSGELMTISKDGSGTYLVTGPAGATPERMFTLTSEEFGRLKGLILETGFMQLPTANYLQRAGLDNFTQYTLTVKSDSQQKMITWVDPEAHDGIIPPIITNIGSQLDNIISKKI